MLWLLVWLALVACGLMAAAIVCGGPSTPPPLASVHEPFRGVDLQALPPLLHHTARDGTPLAYRAYPPAGPSGRLRGSIVLVHGSSARSDSLHPLAQGLAAAGLAVYALDVRGHGASGIRGRVGYVGQLEDDVEDFVRAVQPPAPRRLAGFSAGGGFVLRLAGSARQDLFDAYLLLAPFLGQQACTYRPDSGGWVSVGLPRIVALTALNSLGLKALNGLSVIAFALRPEVQAQLTPRYAYGLAMNFRPHADYRADMAAARRPMAVVVGQDDDQFIASRFADAFKAAARPVPVTLVQGTGHLDLTLRSPGIQAAIAAIEALDRARG